MAKIVGTSAGAITAAVLATDLSIDDLEEILGQLDYSLFLSQKNSPLILNGDPADDLQSPAWTLLFLTVSRQMGEYSSQPFRQWLETMLGRGNLHTFADVKQIVKDRELKVVISNLTRGEIGMGIGHGDWASGMDGDFPLLLTSTFESSSIIHPCIRVKIRVVPFFLRDRVRD